jgi:DNA-binding response OmpR family regulator
MAGHAQITQRGGDVTGMPSPLTDEAYPEDMAQLLVVEDDDAIAAPLERALGREGHTVTRVASGEEAVACALAGTVELVILDLGLPDIDGIEVCRRIRDAGCDVPIFMVTARGEELDRVVGLDVGADDYLAKPFSLAELLARIRALLRRRGTSPSAMPPATSGPADSGRFRLDEAARRVLVADREVPLTVKEFDVLALLAREAGNVVKRERLMDEVWDVNWFGSTKTLDVTVARLRQKLDDHDSPARVVTIRGVGFRLEVDTQDA